MGNGCDYILPTLRWVISLSNLALIGIALMWTLFRTPLRSLLVTLVCIGYTPFDRDTQEQETKAICSGDYKFEPGVYMRIYASLSSPKLRVYVFTKLEEYWQNVSQTARNFVKTCLTIDPAERPTATELLKHEWLASETPYFVADTTGQPTNLLPTIQKGFNARKTCEWFFLFSLFFVGRGIYGLVHLFKLETRAAPFFGSVSIHTRFQFQIDCQK